MKNPELLSPAGSLKKLKAAILFGADAVYAGIPDFSLRSRINDFDYKKLEEGIKFAHSQHKKVYATANIYAHNKHLKEAGKAIKKYQELEADALIVSDPGILDLVKKYAPNLPIHLSTQANCSNWQAVKFWKKQGVARIILARELSIEEIREIHKKVPSMELECFVHGSMCAAYSGRCILSKFFSGQSANQGECSHPCRKAYKISPAEEADNFKNFIIEQDKNGTYLLNSEDLCLIEYLDQLKDAGVVSFKIEGRSKSIYYVAAVTKLYKEAIDNGCKAPEGFWEELKKIPNRGYTSGFLLGEEKCGHNFKESRKECKWQLAGEVELAGKNSINLKVHNEIFINDNLEFISPSGPIIEARVKSLRDLNTGKIVQEIHGGQEKVCEVAFFGKKAIPENSIARRKTK